MKNKKSGIYLIKNLINNKIYVGSSVDLNRRIKTHFNSLIKGNHQNNHLQNSFNKYGIENFRIEVIENCSKNRLREREQFYLDNLKGLYNVSPLAYSNIGVKHTLEEIKKIKKAMKGIKFTKKHKENISISLEKYKKTKTHCKNISKSKKGKKSTFKGKKHSDKTKKLMRRLAKKRIRLRDKKGRFI